MPVRQPRASPGHLTGLFPSLKLGRTVAFESTLERDLIYMLEFDAQVLTYEEQPLSLDYLHLGKARRYVPDFRVVTSQGTLLLECKSASQREDPVNRDKFSVARAYCQERAWRFQVVSETALRTGWRLRNVQTLTYHARFVPPPHLTTHLFNLLATGPHSPRDLTQGLPTFPPAQVRASLLHLAYFHRVSVPLERPLSLDTLYTLPETPYGPPISFWTEAELER